MESIRYFFRFLYRIRWWIIILPLMVSLLMIWETRNMGKTYDVNTTVYTGIITGYSIEESNGVARNQSENTTLLINLINIITAESTLKKVSLRLYARSMINGDPNKDNNYITASKYREIYNRSKRPIDHSNLLGLIDKTSEDLTVANLLAYEKPDKNNFVYGLFNYFHPHYSYNSLKKIKVERIPSSDMLQISYSADDPGIAYNTLDILMKEFVDQYQEIRFGETNKVIQYFEGELARYGRILRSQEDSLTNYYVDNHVINYEFETQAVATMNANFEMNYDQTLKDNKSAQQLVDYLERRVGDQIKLLRDNTVFMDKLNSISAINANIAQAETFQNATEGGTAQTEKLKRDLKEAESDFANFTDNLALRKYTKEGLTTKEIVNSWMQEVLKFESTKAQLSEMERRKAELDEKYIYFAPLGSTIKRKERAVNFTERVYTSILEALNAARLRQKTLQMTSATLKIINPPTYPLNAQSTKRKFMIASAGIGTFLFIMGFFFILEIADRTLRDRFRTERLTNGKVIGAFPTKSNLSYRRYDSICYAMATQALGNALFAHFKTSKSPIILNILSSEKGEGKSFVAEKLADIWTTKGLEVKILNDQEDFDPESKEYMLAKDYTSFYHPKNEDIIIIEYPHLKSNFVSGDLLKNADFNLFVANAKRGLKDTDKQMLEKVTFLSDNNISIVLNKSGRNVVEEFTGQLPPYNLLTNLIYRFSQLSFTESSAPNHR